MAFAKNKHHFSVEANQKGPSRWLDFKSSLAAGWAFNCCDNMTIGTFHDINSENVKESVNTVFVAGKYKDLNYKAKLDSLKNLTMFSNMRVADNLAL